MKRKFLILTLCFTIIFSSINYKKIDAFDLVMTPTLLGITATLALGTGIAIKNNEGLYDVAKGMVNFLGINKIKEMNQAMATIGFHAINGLISIPKKVHEPIKNYFDNVFKPSTSTDVNIGTLGGLPSVYNPTSDWVDKDDFINEVVVSGDYKISFKAHHLVPTYRIARIYYKDNLIKELIMGHYYEYSNIRLISKSGNLYLGYMYHTSNYSKYCEDMISSLASFGGDSSISMPYVPGSYDWDKVGSSQGVNEGDLGIYVPGNVGDLVGNPPGDITKPYDGVYVPGGVISIPGVSNPSIELDSDITIPGDIVTDSPIDPPIDSPIDPPIDSPINPPIGGVIPSFPSFGDSLDFSPMYLTNINEKFPFSLPWDIGRLIQKFDVIPKAPIFKVPIVTSEIELDLTIFDEWAVIVRFFILIGFALSLILISTKLLG